MESESPLGMLLYGWVAVPTLTQAIEHFSYCLGTYRLAILLSTPACVINTPLEAGMQKFKNWFNQKTQEHIEHREQSGDFIGDYEKKPELRKRWLRIDVIGLIILVIALLVLMSGILDYTGSDDSTNPAPLSTDEPTDATSLPPSPLPPTPQILGALIPSAAMSDQSTANT